MEIPMWKALIAGATLLMIAGSTLASAQQSSPAERSHRAQLTADDIAAFTDARIAALKAALKLTPVQEKNWPAVEQAVRDISKERIAQREARRAAGQRTDITERLRDRADALTTRANALRRLADAENSLYQSLDEAQKRRFGIALRFTTICTQAFLTLLSRIGCKNGMVAMELMRRGDVQVGGKARRSGVQPQSAANLSRCKIRERQARSRAWRLLRSRRPPIFPGENILPTCEGLRSERRIQAVAIASTSAKPPRRFHGRSREIRHYHGRCYGHAGGPGHRPSHV